MDTSLSQNLTVETKVHDGNSSPVGRRSSGLWQDTFLLFGFNLVIFWKLFVTGEYSILWSGDNALQAYPWYEFLVTSLHQHSFPFWNPYSEAGRLFIGEPTTGAFYPFNLLLALLPLNSRGLAPAWGLEYSVVLHFFLASLFTYLLARHWGFTRFASIAAGITFAYSGSMSLRYFAQITVFTASVWIPAVFLCYSKALRCSRMSERVLWTNLGGLALAMGLLAGHHQPVLYCGMALGISVVLVAISSTVALGDNNETLPSRKVVLLSFVCLCTFAFLYSSLQLLPSLQYARYAYRWVGLPGPITGTQDAPYSVAGTMYALSPQNIVLMLFPFAGGAETNPYFGILPLFFVIFSWTRIRRSATCRLCWLLGITFLVISLGAYTPIHGLLYYLVPGFAKAREAGRALVLMHFCFAVLVAIGSDALLVPDSQLVLGDKRIIDIFSGASALTFVVIVIFYVRASSLKEATQSYDWLFIPSLLMLMTAALALCRLHELVQLQHLKVAAVVILLLDFHALLGTTIKPKSDFNQGGIYEPTQWYRPDKVVGFLQSQRGTFRINADQPYPRSLGEVTHLETVNGYGATQHKNFADLMTLGARATDLLNVRYAVTQGALPFPQVFQQGKIKVYENPGYLPRVWLTNNMLEVQDDDQVLSALKQQSLDLRTVAVVRGPVTAAMAKLQRGSSNKLQTTADPGYTRNGPNQFSIGAEVKQAGMLVVSETWYPGWHAFVNGTEERIWQVDRSLMGIYVTPGTNTIQFYFRPDYFYIQLFLTLLAIAILAASIAVRLLRPRAV